MPRKYFPDSSTASHKDNKKNKNISSPPNKVLQAHHHTQFILHGRDVGGQLSQVAQGLRSEEGQRWI